MIVQNISELSLVSVIDRGIPNKECISIEINERINLGQFGIMLGMYTEFKMAKPIQDHLFWFGDAIVEKGDWIFICTGAGQPRMSEGIDKGTSIYTIFWGKENTVFANTNIVPILFRIDAVTVIEPPKNISQTKQLT